MTDAKEKRLTGFHVLFYLLGFFGLMFAVNGIFLYSAITSFPGEDIPKSYVQGLNYNETLAQRAAQAELGWQGAVGIEYGELVFVLEDAEGHPVSGYEAEAVLRRAATTTADLQLQLNPRSVGTYAAETGALDKGRWSVTINLRKAGETTPIFIASKDLIIS